MGSARVIKQNNKAYSQHKIYKIAIEKIEESIKTNIIKYLTVAYLKSRKNINSIVRLRELIYESYRK